MFLGNPFPELSLSSADSESALVWKYLFSFTSRSRRENLLWIPAKCSSFQKSIQVLEETTLTEGPHPEAIGAAEILSKKARDGPGGGR